jgi:hypothetical protein
MLLITIGGACFEVGRVPWHVATFIGMSLLIMGGSFLGRASWLK